MCLANFTNQPGMTRCLFAGVVLAFVGSCSNGGFTGSSSTARPVPSDQKDLPVVLPTTSDGRPLASAGPVERTGSGSVGNLQCSLQLSYAPEAIACNIPVNADHIWRKTPGWSGQVSAFPDQAAGFISPEAPANGGCKVIQNSTKLVYVSYVVIPAAGQYNFTAIIDNYGSVRLWRRSDPGREVALAQGDGNGFAQGAVELEATGYAIVVDATDTGIVNGMAFTLRNSAGTVIKRSTSVDPTPWCIFRGVASTDPKTYVPQAAGCRACFGGNNP